MKAASSSFLPALGKRVIFPLVVLASAVAFFAGTQDVGAQAPPWASVDGTYKGYWENDSGTRGADDLELTEDANHNLTGKWGKGFDIVNGKRLTRVTMQWEHRNGGKTYKVFALVQGLGDLRLTYRVFDATGREINTGGGQYQKK